MVCLNGLDGIGMFGQLTVMQRQNVIVFFLETARLTIIFGGNNDVRAAIPFRGAKQAQAATPSFGSRWGK
jgi:hypothetical protein